MSTDLQPLENLYDDEIEKINELSKHILVKWEAQTPTVDNLRELEKEVRGRFYDIGFVAELNAVQFLLDLLEGKAVCDPLQIVVVQRVNPILEFDHEKKAFEVKKDKGLI